MKNRLCIFILSAFATMLLACGENYYYQAELKIPKAIWDSEKAAIFEPEFTDSLKQYNILLSVNNTEEYRHSNFWFFMKTISPEGFSHRDTLEVFLAEESGKWIGDKENDSWHTRFYVKQQVRFPKNGKYTFEIVQGMRDIKLAGISKVGIYIEEFK